jgi:sugar lactone lactonase YvrE
MPVSKSEATVNRTVASILVILVALFLRAWAVFMLPQDYDEPIYLQVALDYADAIRNGNLNGVIDNLNVNEHPALVKLMYSAAILALGKAATYINAFFVSRAVSALFGVLAVILLTIFDPAAGGLLAVHTLAVKYTSQVYLEAIPHALTIAAILAFGRVSKETPNKWFWVSALTLGAASAGKFTYIPVTAIVIVYLAFFEKKIPIYWMTLYALLAGTVFYALDLNLWHDPWHRLLEVLTYHLSYSQGIHVAEVGYPWYQPLIWVFTSSPAHWHPNVFFYFGFDGLISLFAVAGMKREWMERRWLIVWLVSGISFLLLWPTKWPQYALILTPALCIMAAETLHRLYHWLQEQENYWQYLHGMFPQPGKAFWFSISAFVLFLGTIYLSAAIKYTVGRFGWSHITAETSFLPSNTVYDLLAGSDGQMIVATERGVAIWIPPESADFPDHWQLFNTANSGLPVDEVLALTRDAQDNLWFGTAHGLARYDGQTWQAFHAKDLGLQNDQVNALAANSEGYLYAGTLSGVSRWNGERWEAIPTLLEEKVFGLFATNKTLWVAAKRGVFSHHFTTGPDAFYPTVASANAVLVDSTGVVWAATSAGLARLQGSTWTYFNTANSGLPYNTVLTLTEDTSGTFWVGSSRSADVGGGLAFFDGQNWKQYTKDNSGTSASEPLAIVVTDGQVWIGTRTAGIDIFRMGDVP